MARMDENTSPLWQIPSLRPSVAKLGSSGLNFPPLHDALGRRKPAQSFSPPTADHIDRNPRFRNPAGSGTLLRESLFPGY